MGLSIGGLVIDKSYQSDIAGLEQILNKRLVFEGSVTFQKASVNDKDIDHCDVYFTESSTLVMISIDQASICYKIAKQKAVSFVIDEPSMSSSICYTNNSFVSKKILEVEGDVVESKGDPIEFEEQEGDKVALIYHLIEEVLEEYLWDIEPEEECLRYRLESLVSNVAVEEEIPSLVGSIEFEDLEERQEENQVINKLEEITKVKRPKTSILKQVIKGLGLEDKGLKIMKSNKKGNH